MNLAPFLRDGTRFLRPETEEQFREAYETAMGVLRQPEIICCRDCKWSYLPYAVNGKWYCHCLETGAAGRTEDDYCSYAEREEGGE